MAGIPDRQVATYDTDDVPFADMLDASIWLKMLSIYEDKFDNWQKGCAKVDREYSQEDMLLQSRSYRNMPVFWANMEVVKPITYSRKPVPVVSGRHNDRRPLVRSASEMLERALISQQEMGKIHPCLLHIRDDLCLYSRGVGWVRLITHPNGTHEIAYDHIDRHDFRHQVAREWTEVEWVARRAWLTEEQVEVRFSRPYEKLHGEPLRITELQYTDSPGDKDTDEENNTRSSRGETSTDQGTEETVEKKAPVWEIWHKKQGVTVWVSVGQDKVLDISEPELDLEGFFPCPEPAYQTVKPGTLLPIPNLTYYLAQVERINVLTERIMALTDALKAQGFYPAGADGVRDAVETPSPNTPLSLIHI